MPDSNLSVKTPRAPFAQQKGTLHSAYTALRTLKNPNAIPRELWPFKQYVGWVYEDRGPGHKPDKVPKNHRTLGNAAYCWPNTQDFIRPVIETYKRVEWLSGIGFMLTKNDPVTMIDLDGCVNDGKLSPFASEIITALETYWEFSPSGHGLRGLVFCDTLPPAIVRPNLIEIYSQKRLCTLTGNVINPATVAKFANLEWFIDRFVPQAKEEKSESQLSLSRVQHIAPSPDDQELWNRIRRINSLAAQLYQGDLSAIRGQDYSLAVLMLLNCLARQTQGDAARMDRMIRMTALDSSKFDSPRDNWTWLQARIQDAIKHEAGQL